MSLLDHPHDHPMWLAIGDPLLDERRLAALEATGLLGGTPSPVLDRIARLATRLLQVPVSLASLVSGTHQSFAGLAGLTGWAGETRQTPLSHSFCRHGVRHAPPFVVEDASRHPLVADNPARFELHVSAYAGVPLRLSTGELLGAFCAIDAEPRTWSDDDITLLEELASMATAEIELRVTATALHQARRQCLYQMRHDALTGLRNRHGFLEAARDLLTEARRDKVPCLLVELELAHLREVNVRHGFLAGDALLVEATTLLEAAIRPGDLVARTGSAEFALLVRHATEADIPFLDARLAAAIDVHNASPTRDMPLALHRGYAAWTWDAPRSVSALLQAADTALHHALKAA